MRYQVHFALPTDPMHSLVKYLNDGSPHIDTFKRVWNKNTPRPPMTNQEVESHRNIDTWHVSKVTARICRIQNKWYAISLCKKIRSTNALELLPSICREKCQKNRDKIRYLISIECMRSLFSLVLCLDSTTSYFYPKNDAQIELQNSI